MGDLVGMKRVDKNNVVAETGSVYFDPQRAAEDDAQLINLVQMGDGAGACVVSSARTASTAQSGFGGQISNVFYGCAGLDRRPGICLTSGGSERAPTPGTRAEFAHDYASIRREGRSLFHHALAEALNAGIDTVSIDYFIPHQANGQMANLLARELAIPSERVFVNADRVGNTGSAAIWLALSELRALLPPRQRVCALGAEASKFMFGGFLYVHG